MRRGSGARDPGVVPAARAARELGLAPMEFETAMRLGHIRSETASDGRGRAVSRAEIARLRAVPDFPEGLRARVALVGAAEGAALLDVSPGRFARLARLGLFSPVRFRLNRYRTVVWLYLAEELREFAALGANRPLLAGRFPEAMRTRVGSGMDLRARNWRGRHAGMLLRDAHGPWERAAVSAALLPPAALSEAVRDPYERALLLRLRPPNPWRYEPGSAAAGVVTGLMTAADEDEVEWLRTSLRLSLAEARQLRPAPRPAPGRASPRGAADSSVPRARRLLRAGLLRRIAVPWRREGARGKQPGPDRATVAGAPRGAECGCGTAGSQDTGRKSPSCTTDTSMRPCRS
ncbi:hypothetical protein HUT18_01865 [Streptomyces sp. NA04227]|nr:hypothetical protein HUT18_01865 [Streptomyces sp. NA04227]